MILTEYANYTPLQANHSHGSKGKNGKPFIKTVVSLTHFHTSTVYESWFHHEWQGNKKEIQKSLY